jgi:outer membrane protein OmpA-like peptidoglycan-associated protein
MCDICVTNREGDHWTEPKNLGKPINTKYNESNASISADGKTLYFVSTRPDGFGGYDIWYSNKDEKGNWMDPKNIGPVINTPENEAYVFMHWDGVSLYFSSDGHGGFGQSDIFLSRKVGDGWSEPVNLGPSINSPDKEIYFTIPGSGDLAYFSSTRSDTLGLEDIYAVPIPSTVGVKGLTLVYGIVANIDTCSKFSIDPKLKIKIYDIKSCTPVESVIRIADSSTDVEKYLGKTKSDGSYKVIIQAGTDYNLNAYAKGFSFHSERFVVPADAAYKEVEKNILLTPLKVGEVVVLHNIYFDFDKAVLRPESKAEMANLIRLLNENPSLKLEIRGHTDNKGSDEYNIRLSKARAKAVVDYVEEVGGIDKDRLTSVGYSFHLPIASNDADEGRQLNRRVEFKIISQ